VGDDRRWLGPLILVVGIAGVLAAVFAPEDSPFDRDDAVACAERVADRLGQEVVRPSATERDGTWEVTAGGDGVLLRLLVRGADERITEVELLAGGRADVLEREERLEVLEAGC